MTAMIKYQRNNIIFRIASSDAISKFKSVQAHAFIQLARSDIGFDVAAREVVLLEYDRLSQWLYRMERILLSVGEGEMHHTLRHAILESFREEMLVIEGVTETHSEVFDTRVSKFAKLIHSYAFSLITEEMSKKMEKTIDKAFGELTDLVSEYLQHLLISMHEYNNNLVTQKDEPFLSYSFYCQKQKNTPYHFTPIIKRAEFFKMHEAGDTFVLKNYANGGDIHDDVSSALKDIGVFVVRDTNN